MSASSSVRSCRSASGTGGQVAGQEEPDQLVGEARARCAGRPAGRSGRPRRSASSASSAGRGQRQVLAGDVEQPGRQLPEPRADRVPVLPDQHHPVVVVERDHADRADVRALVARGGAAAGHGHLVGDDREDRPAEPLACRARRVAVVRRATADRSGAVDSATSTGSSSAAAYVDGGLDERRRTAGAAGSAGSSAPGAPGWPRRTGAARGPARRTRPAGRPARCRRCCRPALVSASR